MPTVSWYSRFKKSVRHFWDFILPPTCAGCGSIDELLCGDCIAMLPWLGQSICLCCGRSFAQQIACCRSCRYQPLPLKQIRATFLFAPPIPQIIHQLKYRGAFALARPLATLMVEGWSRWQPPVDVVLPIPLHPKREKERGYNQEALLVHHFCRQLNLPNNPEALKRVKYTKLQVNLSAASRSSNMTAAFWANQEKVTAKKILLVDDVCTTGATLAAAARALLAAGAESVSAYCLARAN